MKPRVVRWRVSIDITLDVTSELDSLEDVAELAEVAEAHLRQITGVHTTVHAVKRLPAVKP